MSSLARAAGAGAQGPEELCIERATFRWTAARAPADDARAAGDDAASTSTRTAVEAERGRDGDGAFELRDITLRLARGRLTVRRGVDGPGRAGLTRAACRS